MRPRAESFEVRCSAEEKRAIERAAQRHGMTLSEYVRAVAMQDQLADLDAEVIRRVVNDLVETLARRMASSRRKHQTA